MISPLPAVLWPIVVSFGLAQPPALPAPSEASAPHADPSSTAPPAGHAIRIGGDLDADISRENDGFRCGPCRITTDLPVGYPDPTPPGAIDIKTYPSVRRAEISGERNPDSGMNRAFWPLFQHIKKHDIAMTSPVEMDYRGLTADRAQPTAWTMSFLYRSQDMNTVGEDGTVVVVDTEPVTVLAIGMKGSYSVARVRSGLESLRLWLNANPVWQEAGEPRALFYNGPEVGSRNKWLEVQLPITIRPTTPPTKGQEAVENPAGPTPTDPPAGSAPRL